MYFVLSSIAKKIECKKLIICEATLIAFAQSTNLVLFSSFCTMRLRTFSGWQPVSCVSWQLTKKERRSSKTKEPPPLSPNCSIPEMRVLVSQILLASLIAYLSLCSHSWGSKSKQVLILNG